MSRHRRPLLLSLLVPLLACGDGDPLTLAAEEAELTQSSCQAAGLPAVRPLEQLGGRALAAPGDAIVLTEARGLVPGRVTTFVWSAATRSLTRAYSHRDDTAGADAFANAITITTTPSGSTPAAVILGNVEIDVPIPPRGPIGGTGGALLAAVCRTSAAGAAAALQSAK
jgi:hypothetical protein